LKKRSKKLLLISHLFFSEDAGATRSILILARLFEMRPKCIPVFMFAWDTGKRLLTLRQRGLDFIDAELASDGRPAPPIESLRAPEMRFLTIALEIDP
jgi:hypothetical protein